MYSEVLTKFNNIMRESTGKYASAKETVTAAELEIQDILHYIENNDIDDAETCIKLIKALHIIRKKRREAKDIIKIIESIIKWGAVPNNKKSVNSISTLIGEVRKAEKEVSDVRYYNNRTDIVEQIMTTDYIEANYESLSSLEDSQENEGELTESLENAKEQIELENLAKEKEAEAIKEKVKAIMSKNEAEEDSELDVRTLGVGRVPSSCKAGISEAIDSIKKSSKGRGKT